MSENATNPPSRSKSRLGRGLSSLISVSEPVMGEIGTGGAAGAPAAEAAAPGGVGTVPGLKVLEVALNAIVPNPHQPRRKFDETSLNELAESLKSTGLIQPIIVRPAPEQTGKYQLIAGERRWRAAQRAALPAVPAIVRDIDSATQAQMALIENIQREDLNPLDRAAAYRTLIKHLGLTQAELAGRLGEDRSTITHFLRLLDMPETVQGFVGDGRLSMAHAKILSGVTDPAEQRRLAELAVAQNLSVRNLERLVQTDGVAPTPSPTPPPASPHVKELERNLSRQLALRVQIRGARKKGHGRLVLYYTSLDQFDELMNRLGVKVDVD
jgi:ParB family chromosome partitioning protein